MRAVPFTRVSGILPLVRCLERTGAPVERLARQAGVPSRLFDRPEAPIPMRPASLFYETAARSLGCENLGSRLGRSTDAFELGVYGALLRRTRTLYECLTTAATFVPRFATGHRDWIEEEADQIWYCMGLCEGIEVGKRQVQGLSLQLTLQSLRKVLAADWEPPLLRLPDHGEAWVRGLELGSRVEIDARRDHVAIAIPRADLARPLPDLPASGDQDPRRKLRATAPPESFVDSLCLVLRGLLGEGLGDLETLSAVVGTSARSLQRALAQQGLTYSKLLERCRLTAARELLTTPDARVIDVAYEVGYSDPGNFSRAFRRWSGLTPREFQRQAATSL